MKKQIMLVLSVLAIGATVNSADEEEVSFEEVSRVEVTENKRIEVQEKSDIVEVVEVIEEFEEVAKIELVEEIEEIELVEEIEELKEEVEVVEVVKDTEVVEEIEEEFTDEEIEEEEEFEKWIKEFDLKDYKLAVTAYEIYRDEFLFTDGESVHILVNQTDLPFYIFDGMDYFIRTNNAETEIFEYELVGTITIEHYRELHSGKNRQNNYELGKKMIHEQEPKDWIHAPVNEFEQEFEEVENEEIEVEEVEAEAEAETVEEIEEIETEVEVKDESELEQGDSEKIQELMDELFEDSEEVTE